MTTSYIYQKQYREYISSPGDLIKNALIKLNEVNGLFQIILDKDCKLLGTLTDGDIRRGILKGIKISNGKVEDFMNKLPIYGLENKNIDHLKIIKTIDRKPIFLPILNEKNEMVSILVKDHNETITQAIIMAGGMGSRLGNLTKNTPKPLLKVKGVPILEYCIKQLENEGIQNIYVSVNYLAEKIIDYINNRKSKSNIIIIYEEKKLGTVGSLSLISKKIKGPIFIMNADLLTNVSLEAMTTYHLNGKFSSTTGGAIYENIIPCGVLKASPVGYLESIEEKPIVDYLVAGGVYILNAEVYSLLTYNQYCDMPDLLNKSVKKNFKNSVFPIHEKWRDIGKIDEYNKANAE